MGEHRLGRRGDLRRAGSEHDRREDRAGREDARRDGERGRVAVHRRVGDQQRTSYLPRAGYRSRSTTSRITPASESESVYRHFPDREQLIDGLFEQRIDEVAALLQEAVEDPDPWHGLTHFLDANLALQAQDRGLRELLLGAAGGFDRLARARARLQPIGARLIARAQEAGALRADIEPQDLPLLQLMLSSLLGHDAAPDLWRRYLAIVLRGLRSEPCEPEPLPAAPPPAEQVEKVMAAAWGGRR